MAETNPKTDQQKLNDYYPEYVQELPEGHPVRTYFMENFYIRRVLTEIQETDATTDFQKFFNLFNQLSEVEKRYARKENQLFPFLEKRGWNGPSQGMWAFHDSIRDLLRAVRKKTETRSVAGLNKDMQLISAEMQRLMSVEEMRLFPISLQMLQEDDWKEMSVGEKEIGWMLPQEPAEYAASANVSAPAVTEEPASVGNGLLRMDEGYMTLQQVNFLLKCIPVDLTYVDENDRVIFYNRGEERVFPRSAGIIGREVRFCHPPKSVGTVLKILEEFRKGTKSEAEFWIRFKGQVIHIRYFAVRDENKNYKGVIEMSQDITDIQKLEGERRLLNWDEGENT
jgi:PAS domain S-box-containing protein